MASVVIPTLNEEACIASVVAFAMSDASVEEVIVVDDASLDATVERAESAGARVIQSTLLGKGASMRDGMLAARSECLVFLDGDLQGLQPGLISNLVNPLLSGEADFVKAAFSRTAGRVTTLTVKPLLQIFFPELADFSQPIGGIFAARRSLLRRCEFENDYGVDVGLLIDASLQGARLVEVDIGHIEHDSQSLSALGRMAQQVLRVILERALAYGRLDAEILAEAREVERHMSAKLDNQVKLHSESKPLIILPLGGVVATEGFADFLARKLGREKELEAIKQLDLPYEEAMQRKLAVFQGLPAREIEAAALSMPLSPSIVDTVAGLRKQGFRVCLLGELFHAATELIRRRIYADLCFSHMTRREGPEQQVGQLVLAPAFVHPNGCKLHVTCESNVIRHLLDHYDLEAWQIIVVGKWPDNACLLEAVGQSFILGPSYDTAITSKWPLVKLGELPGLLGLAEDLDSSQLVSLTQRPDEYLQKYG